jgi:hypothetical protein
VMDRFSTAGDADQHYEQTAKQRGSAYFRYPA